MPESPLPLLVLLPGMDGTGVMFEPFVKAAAGFETRVVRYPPELTSYEDCIRLARRALPTDRPFLLLGESFSGPVAIALAAERPAGLVGLVLCVTFAKNPRPGLASWAAPLLRALPPLRLPLPLLRRLLLGRRKPPQALADLVQTMLPQVPQATLKARLLAVVEVDHTSRLGQIQVPILALCASGDRLVPPAAIRWLREHLAALDILTLRAPHWLLQTRPEAAIQGIRDFLKRIGA